MARTDDVTKELEQLQAQKKEIEQRIKELTAPRYEVDGARFYVSTYKGKPTGWWIVTVEQIGGVSGTAYKELIRAKSKEEALEALSILRCTLEDLQDKVEAAANRQK